MSRTTKRLSLLLAVTVCIALAAAHAFASSGIQVMLNSLNILYNGEKTDLDHFVYNNTAYVPLRKAAELFGKEVTWDQATRTVNISDKKTDGSYAESDAVSTALIANAAGNTIDLEFQVRNNAGKDITITLYYPFYDFAVYDESGNEVYRHSEEYPFSILPIVDETINSGGKFTVNEKLDLSARDFAPGETYRVDFFVSFEMDSEMHKLSESAYFKIPG